MTTWEELNKKGSKGENERGKDRVQERKKIKAQIQGGDLLERRKSGVGGRDEKVVRVECTQSSFNISMILPKIFN